MLKLQFKDQRKPAIWLVDARYAIGKDTQNNIIIADEGVSAFHAEIRVEGDQVFITDTGSANGTFVNGKRIQRRTELRAADTIRLHNVELLLVDPKQEHAAAPEGATAISPALANIPIAGAAGSKAGSGWVLKAKTGSIVGKTYPVPTIGKLVIGRANNCDIQLPANHVSRQHAEVQVTGGKLVVRDLNSSNGTFVNRKKVTEGELAAGDEVRFDTFSFEVIGPAAAGAAPAPAAEEAGRTQFRPAVSATAARPKAEPPPAAKPAAAKPASPTSPTRVAPKVEDQKVAGGNSSGIVLVVVLLVAAGAGAWFFLK